MRTQIHIQDLEADRIAVASKFVLGLPVLGIFLLPVFIVAMLEAVGIHNKVQLLFGSGYVFAGLKLVMGIFAILALLDQLLQRVCVRLADNLEALVKIILGPIGCGRSPASRSSTPLRKRSRKVLQMSTRLRLNRR